MVLRSKQMLCNIEHAMSIGARLALGLNRFTLFDAALTVANIMLASLQILRRLCRYIVQNHRYDFVFVGKEDPLELLLLS